MSGTKKISILGSTGSIGVQSLEIVAASNGTIEVLGLAAGRNIDLLCRQIEQVNPKVVSVQEESDISKIKEKFPNIDVYFGEDGLTKVATLDDIEIVLVSVVGVAALKPTIEAIKLKKDIALASKEVLVAAGGIIMPLIKEYGVKMLPVDSEHSAVMQSFYPNLNKNGYLEYPTEQLEKIILTASGGAFRDLKKEDLKDKVLADALKHPNWDMGQKITIDSATLMNKGLEVIEAHWLFGVGYDQIEVVIHPQSIVHSFVEYKDGSVIAQLGLPDMRLPIQYAFSYPKRVTADWPKMKLNEIKELTFRKPDLDTFKGLKLAFDAGKAGGTMTAVFNAANEAAVELFTRDKIKFLDISDLVEKVMHQHDNIQNPTLDDIIAADLWARNEVFKNVG